MHTLTVFFIGVAVALAVALCLAYFIGGSTKFNLVIVFVAGFVIGMLTLYIKMRLLGF
jgi:uncharacterized membrane protein YjjP (DUF1212 family)